MQQLLLVAMEDIYPLTKHLTAAAACCCWLSFILSIANTSSYLSDSGLDFTELNVWQDELISLLHRCSPSHHGAAKEHLTRVHAHTRTHTYWFPSSVGTNFVALSCGDHPFLRFYNSEENINWPQQKFVIICITSKSQRALHFLMNLLLPCHVGAQKNAWTFNTGTRSK